MFNSAVIYYFPGSPRYQLVNTLVEHCGLSDKITFKDINKCKPEFVKLFPEQKIPAFYEKEDDFKLTEVIAISYYLLSLGQDNQKENVLAGVKNKDKATILRWMSFFNQEFMKSATAIFYALQREDADEDETDVIAENYERLSEVLIPEVEEQLKKKNNFLSYLDHITLCDIFGALVFSLMFQAYLGKEWRSAHPAIMKWYNTVLNSEYLKGSYSPELLEKDAFFVK
ncbi:hypothetical protein ACO0RG_003861 [Hanseniaspora osmophila]|uniref:Putative elongation factor 1 gamma n=1 Tax=Hanseniaspora osmophila TaxID=56408 RepID=A0A1E5RBB8_9ASCO|nr:putative elongation factor 1 gamma [Hanseniaspora osmophila]